MLYLQEHSLSIACGMNSGLYRLPRLVLSRFYRRPGTFHQSGTNFPIVLAISETTSSSVCTSLIILSNADLAVLVCFRSNWIL